MADFNNLKAAIRAAIYENEDQAITGDVLQEVLLEMVDLEFKTINGESIIGEGDIIIDTANLVRSTTIRNMVTLSQAEYDALADKDANTFYVII